MRACRGESLDLLARYLLKWLLVRGGLVAPQWRSGEHVSSRVDGVEGSRCGSRGQRGAMARKAGLPKGFLCPRESRTRFFWMLFMKQWQRTLRGSAVGWRWRRCARGRASGLPPPPPPTPSPTSCTNVRFPLSQNLRLRTQTSFRCLFGISWLLLPRSILVSFAFWLTVGAFDEQDIEEVGFRAHSFAELAGRVESNFNDLRLTFEELGVSLHDLSDFANKPIQVPFPKGALQNYLLTANVPTRLLQPFPSSP